MTGTIECRYYGRDFTADEMALLRTLVVSLFSSIGARVFFPH